MQNNAVRIGDASLVQSRAIIPGVRGELLRNLAFWDHPVQKFGTNIVELKFYIRFSSQQNRFKLRKLVTWIECFNTFLNK